MNDTTQVLERVVVRFAGDSGDGMQLVGTQFTRTAAMAGNDLATMPDFPAEIRAPAGTRAGVSGFQVQFSSHNIYTAGDVADALVALNPAALITNLQGVRDGGIVIVNTDKFTERDFEKAQLSVNPLEDGTLDGYRVVEAPIGSMTREAVAAFGLKTKEAERCKNLFALGMMYWLYGRTTELTEEWINGKFKEPYRGANIAALHAGHAFAETAEVFQAHYEVPKADLPPATYRSITGNAALALGLAAAAVKSGKQVFYGSYPITPASDVLHALAPFKNHGVATFQAEDEIAAVCSAIGASYGGAIGVTGTSGPGLALKGEAIGLALTAELPLVILNVQRAGPSTGLPTKTEQSDLLMALHGRNGEAPMAVVAASRPGDCFEVAYEAARISVKYMVPVLVLSDGYIANGAEPWPLPDLDDMKPFEANHPTDPEGFQPYSRDEKTLARPWALPGTPGMEHRLGGLEKEHITGNVSYDPPNHEMMCKLRAEKVQRITQDIAPLEVHGTAGGTLVVGWGGTFGALRTAVDQCLGEGERVAHLHLRWMSPLPADLPDVLSRYDKVIVAELNLGQLNHVLRAEYLLDAVPLCKIQGQPFKTSEVKAKLDEVLASQKENVA